MYNWGLIDLFMHRERVTMVIVGPMKRIPRASVDRPSCRATSQSTRPDPRLGSSRFLLTRLSGPSPSPEPAHVGCRSYA